MRILTYTTLFPNANQQRFGIFVQTRLRHLLNTGEIDAKVVAPVPWFPSKSPRFGVYAKYADIPRRETRAGIEVLHPRYTAIPKVGMMTSPFLLALASLPTIKKQKREFDFHIIDSHYFYPDGVAAAILAKWLNVPLVVTARGSDVNLLPQYAVPRKLIQWSAGRADAIITVSNALRDRLIELGVDEGKITTIRNGVDLTIFKPSEERYRIRQELGVDKYLLLSVGNLVESKGHHLVIDALAHFNDAKLLIIGDGPEKNSLERRAERLGVTERVTIMPPVDQSELHLYYSAADILILASAREGWPNVLLESMACGTPVVASMVGGIPEIIQSDKVGYVIDQLSGTSIKRGIGKVLSSCRDKQAILSYAKMFGWEDVARLQVGIYKELK